MNGLERASLVAYLSVEWQTKFGKFGANFCCCNFSPNLSFSVRWEWCNVHLRWEHLRPVRKITTVNGVDHLARRLPLPRGRPGWPRWTLDVEKQKKRGSVTCSGPWWQVIVSKCWFQTVEISVKLWMKNTVDCNKHFWNVIILIDRSKRALQHCFWV